MHKLLQSFCCLLAPLELALSQQACSAAPAHDDSAPTNSVAASGATPGSGGTNPGGGAAVAGTPPTNTATANGGSMLSLGDQAMASGGAATKCEPKAIGIVRDFRADDGGHYGHPDFQSLRLFKTDDYIKDVGYPEPGIVLPTLGADKKPVFSGGPFKTVTSQATFDQWYRDTPDVNIAIQHEIPLQKDPTKGTLVFDTDAFFPIDGQGFGNYGPGKDGIIHNFHFTFELHLTFAYSGGELFDFRGDDDVFVFINGHLVIDLGGVHAPMHGAVQLDERAAELGIETGHEYPIDIFQAERFTDQSNFRLETSLTFTNCTPIFAEPR